VGGDCASVRQLLASSIPWMLVLQAGLGSQSALNAHATATPRLPLLISCTARTYGWQQVWHLEKRNIHLMKNRTTVSIKFKLLAYLSLHAIYPSSARMHAPLLRIYYT
jgi:hypothetical protein